VKGGRGPACCRQSLAACCPTPAERRTPCRLPRSGLFLTLSLGFIFSLLTACGRDCSGGEGALQGGSQLGPKYVCLVTLFCLFVKICLFAMSVSAELTRGGGGMKRRKEGTETEGKRYLGKKGPYRRDAGGRRGNTASRTAAGDLTGYLI